MPMMERCLMGEGIDAQVLLLSQGGKVASCNAFMCMGLQSATGWNLSKNQLYDRGAHVMPCHLHEVKVGACEMRSRVGWKTLMSSCMGVGTFSAVGWSDEQRYGRNRD